MRLLGIGSALLLSATSGAQNPAAIEHHLRYGVRVAGAGPSRRVLFRQ